MYAYLLYENSLVEYAYDTYAKTKEAKISEMISYLKKQNDPFEVMLYENTILDSVEIENGTAILSFSLLDYDLSKERKLVESIIYFCTQLEGIDCVQFKLKDEILTQMPKGGLCLNTTTRAFGINTIDTNQLYLHEGNSSVLYCIKQINGKNYFMPKTIRIKKQNIYDEKLTFLLQGSSANVKCMDPLVKHNIKKTKETSYEDGILHVYLNAQILNKKKQLKRDCKEVLKRSFIEDTSIQQIHVHVEDETYQINVRNL